MISLRDNSATPFCVEKRKSAGRFLWRSPYKKRKQPPEGIRMTNEHTDRSTAQEALHAYLESLVSDPEHATLNTAGFTPDELPLANQAMELGQLISDERIQAEELAEGIFDSKTAQKHREGNPLTESFESIRTNLAVPTAIANAIDSDDYSLEFDANNGYLAQLKHSVEELRERHQELERNAYTDFLTGVGNRAALNRDTDAAWDSQTAYTLAFVDIDGLKYCNDHYGHAEGNKYIKEVANCLRLHRRSGERLYRIGGDEFVMLSPCSSESEMTERLEACRSALIAAHTIDENFAYSFSYGCSHATPASGDSRSKLVNDADKRMYDYKLLHGSHHKNATRSAGLETPEGIEERVFQAMSFQTEGRYLFICNINTNQSRWSRNAVRDFDLPGEVMYRMDKVWEAHIHPDDRHTWRQDIDEIFGGKKYHHSMSYRAKDASGRYVMVNCTGVRLDGAGDEPTLFVGTIVNRNAADGTDPATGLDDVRSLISEVDRRKQKNLPTNFVVVKIGGISEINSTYGYEAGNDALSQMSDRLLSKIAGKARLYRSYGLQFVVVFDGDENGADLARYSDAVRGILEQPVHIQGVNVLLPVVTAAAHYESITSQALSVLSDLNRRIDAATRSTLESNPFSSPLHLTGENVVAPSNTDSLTGLLHSSEFLSRATKYSRMHIEEQHCMIAIDLGHMRIYNEWYGRQKGDSLLAEVGTALAALEATGIGLAGHWGQDDFSVHMPLDTKAIEILYNRIRGIVAAHDDSIGFMPAFGVCPLQPGADVNISDYDKAKFALEETKDNFKKRVAFFNAEKYRRREEEHLLLSEFQRALASNRVNFFLQPQYNMKTDKIVGAEALARWRRIDGTYVSPAVFVPLLERNGFIAALDRHIWEQVFIWIKKCYNRGLTPPPVSINVSRMDIESIDVASCLNGLAEKHHVPTRCIKVEITESMYTEDQRSVQALTTQLKKLGFSVYMDDFGSGQSSLSMLRDINVDVVKLDGGFLSDGSVGERSTGIVKSVVKMTKSLGMPVIVEGVETTEQAQFLKDMGCRYAQGFLYFRPMPPCDFETILHDSSKIDLRGIVPPGEDS